MPANLGFMDGLFLENQPPSHRIDIGVVQVRAVAVYKNAARWTSCQTKLAQVLQKPDLTITSSCICRADVLSADPLHVGSAAAFGRRIGGQFGGK
jgi:hypothetical protein